MKTRTRTHGCGYGFQRVRVWVALENPRVARDIPYSRIPSIYHRRGASIMRSMHFYSLRTSKMMSMVQIIRDHQQT
jgi:hypothetical protein